MSTIHHPDTSAARHYRPWIWIVVAFAVQITVWTVWIAVASKRKPADVPLATTSAHR